MGASSAPVRFEVFVMEPGSLDPCDNTTCTAATAGSSARERACVRDAKCVLGGCVYDRYPDGTPCDDGDAKTEMDTCYGGVCVGVDVWSPTPTRVLAGLTPGTEYGVRVRTHNGIGFGPFTAASQVAVPVRYVVFTAVGATDVTSTRVKLEWNVNDRAAVERFFVFRDGLLLLFTEDTSVTVSSLDPGTAHTFHIAARLHEEEGDSEVVESEDVVVSTLPAGTSCPPLSVPNGAVGATPIAYKVTASCNAGFELDGPESVVCESTNTWSDSPRCVACEQGFYSGGGTSACLPCTTCADGLVNLECTPRSAGTCRPCAEG